MNTFSSTVYVIILQISQNASACCKRVINNIYFILLWTILNLSNIQPISNDIFEIILVTKLKFWWAISHFAKMFSTLTKHHIFIYRDFSYFVKFFFKVVCCRFVVYGKGKSSSLKVQSKLFKDHQWVENNLVLVHSWSLIEGSFMQKISNLKI